MSQHRLGQEQQGQIQLKKGAPTSLISKAAVNKGGKGDTKPTAGGKAGWSRGELTKGKKGTYKCSGATGGWESGKEAGGGAVFETSLN